MSVAFVASCSRVPFYKITRESIQIFKTKKEQRPQKMHLERSSSLQMVNWFKLHHVRPSHFELHLFPKFCIFFRILAHPNLHLHLSLHLHPHLHLHQVCLATREEYDALDDAVDCRLICHAGAQVFGADPVGYLFTACLPVPVPVPGPCTGSPHLTPPHLPQQPLELPKMQTSRPGPAGGASPQVSHLSPVTCLEHRPHGVACMDLALLPGPLT